MKRDKLQTCSTVVVVLVVCKLLSPTLAAVCLSFESCSHLFVVAVGFSRAQNEIDFLCDKGKRNKINKYTKIFYPAIDGDHFLTAHDTDGTVEAGTHTGVCCLGTSHPSTNVSTWGAVFDVRNREDMAAAFLVRPYCCLCLYFWRCSRLSETSSETAPLTLRVVFCRSRPSGPRIGSNRVS